MKVWIRTFCLALCLLYVPIQIFADPTQDSFLAWSIENESLKIQQTSSDDYKALTDLHASRGEGYLVLGEDQRALEDFLLSYEYALICEEEKNDLSFRPLFGAFLAYVRLEDLESAQMISVQLDSILRNACCDCGEPSSHLGRHQGNRIPSQGSILPCQADWPILGPDHIAIRDCLERVDNTVKGLTLLLAAVRRPEVSALALVVVYKLEDVAKNCCRAGGIWKGCLQKLVNRLHFWRESGVPDKPT